MKILILFFSTLCIVLPSHAQQERTVTIRGLSVPLHDAEVVPPSEAGAIDDAIETMKEFFKLQYQKTTIDDRTGMKIEGSRRGVHPTTHACLKGTFTIQENLPYRLQAGIFQPGYQYDVITRFSNALPRGKSKDQNSDSRGLGIKVLGVNGEPILDQKQAHGNTQDFTLNTTDTFFATNAKNYADFMRLATVESLSFSLGIVKYFLTLLNNFENIPRVFKAFREIQSVQPTSLLNINYFSISPYQNGLGSTAPLVKYIIKPCGGGEAQDVNPEDPFFLRHILQKEMKAKGACFNFYIQERTNPDLEIEDLTKPWPEAEAPATYAGRLILPQQEFMNEIFCEKIVINPWNTLPEHKPVGGINRLRLGVYATSIELRKNAVVTEAQ